MVYINPGGHNWGPIIFDDVAKAYVAIIALWTAFITSGVYGIWHNRKLPFIRMRNPFLLGCSVGALQIYLVMVFIVYPLNGTFTCSAEYWIMTLYLPIGIALFQLQNTVLLSRSLLQEDMVWTEHEHTATRARALRDKTGLAYLIERFKQMTAFMKTRTLIVVGLVVQLIVSLIIYFVSRKFHSYGVTSHTVSPGECRRGWEWAPTIVWQLLWSWVFGPFLLFKIRRIHDIHYWRLQTSLSIFASLPGAPLWLLAVYSDTLANVNKYWVAPMWFALGIMAMEFVTLFFPLLEVYQRRQHIRSVDAINPRNAHGVPVLGGDQGTGLDSIAAPSRAPSRRNHDMNNMVALNNALTTNIAPLLDFAATKDFSAENILFLRDVSRFKELWNLEIRDGTISAASKCVMFTEAVKIYEEYVSPRLSRAPINISGPMRVALEIVFESASAQRLRPASHENPVTPFASAIPLTTFNQPSGREHLRSHSHEQVIDAIVPAPAPGSASELPTSPAHLVEAPETFRREVFDQAEANVKYTVLTNTWSRFLEKFETTSMASSDEANTLSSHKSIVTTSMWTKS